MALIVPKRFFRRESLYGLRKPVGPVRIMRDNPLFPTREMWTFGIGDSPYNTLNTGNTGSLQGSARFDGDCLTIPAINSHFLSDTVPIFPAGSAKSILLIVTPKDLTPAFVYALHNGTSAIFVRHTSVGGTWGLYTGAVNSSGEVLPLNQKVALLITDDGSSIYQMYSSCGGKLNTTPSTGSFWGSAKFYIGSYNTGGLNAPMEIHDVWTWDRCLNDQEALSLTSNPYQIYEPAGPTYFIFPASTVPTATKIPVFMHHYQHRVGN